jgi:cytochrome b561
MNPHPTGYSVVARLLHWATALVILGLTGLGWWMVDLSYYDAWYNRGLDLHKSFGIIAYVLAVAFIIRKLIGQAPAPATPLTTFERIGAKAAHGMLFILMLLMPVSGYLISTSSGDGVDVFGIVTVPALIKTGDQARDLAIDLHYWLAYVGLGIIAVHTLAAIKHHVINKDRTLMRMLSGR